MPAHMPSSDAKALIAAWMRGETLAPTDLTRVLATLADGYASALAMSFGATR